jgi:hypothetical protein
MAESAWTDAPKAPVAPKKRHSQRAKTKVPKTVDGKHAPPKHREGAIIDDRFMNTKKDRRTIKASSFLNRVEKGHQKPVKRRRPSKKLVTTLESLADALPETGDAEAVVGDAKIRHKSMKSRPGATKRKAKLEIMEKERFGKNMAQLTSSGVVPASSGTDVAISTSSRWAALRGFISTTLEQKDEFLAK